MEPCDLTIEKIQNLRVVAICELMHTITIDRQVESHHQTISLEERTELGDKYQMKYIH